MEKGFTDAGNFVIDTTGLIGDLGKDIGSSIAHTATDIGHTVVNIGKDIGHAIGSKFDLLTVCSKIMNTHQGMVYLIWFCFSLSSFFYISFNLDMVYYQFSVTMKHGCSRIVTDFGETFLDCLF